MLLAIAVVVLIATVPALQTTFGLVSLPLSAWLLVVPAMFIPTLVLEIVKRWQQRARNAEQVVSFDEGAL